MQGFKNAYLTTTELSNKSHHSKERIMYWKLFREKTHVQLEARRP